MSLAINLEIGHDASIKPKATPQGFTHDWEVFVRGCNGSDIHYFVEKVVFYLHYTFVNPTRVVKEPPYSLKTEGYAGFNLPIDIYLKNTQEPKKIRFNYDLELQPITQPPLPPIHRVQKKEYIFQSVSEEFRSKLLKGGALPNTTGTQENNDKSEEKSQMTSKPKLTASESTKKYKTRPEDHRPDDAFRNLFGTPITKTSRPEPPPKPKEPTKNSSSKSDKVAEKEKPKTKSPHKDKDRDKEKIKDKSESSDKKSKDDKKDKKDKKDKERSKDKRDRKDRERDKSPVRTKSPSPRSPKVTRSPSPPPTKSSSSKDKEPSKDKDSKDKREKPKKDKHKEHKDKHKDKEKDRDRSSGDSKDYKSRDSSKSKESTSSIKEEDPSPNNSSIQSQYSQNKAERKEKPKEKEPTVKEVSKEPAEEKSKSEDKPKHKHKKKDKDRKEKKEEKSHKQDKKPEKSSAAVTSSVKEPFKESPTVTSSKEKNIDRTNLFGSPKSDPPSTPVETKRPSHSLIGLVDDDTSCSSKVSSREPSPVPPPVQLPPTPPPVVEAPPPKKAEPEPAKKTKEELKKKEKKDKKKDKKAEKEKRKRKPDVLAQEKVTDGPPEKLIKESVNLNNNSDDERKVSSTEDAHPPLVNVDAEAYMSTLRELQHKIMGLKDNSDLQKVVQLIAKTGQYEVTANTFDFDLCLLEPDTVRQLQDFFATVQ